MANGREFSAILAYNHLEEFLLSDGTSGAFGGYFGVPSCAASNTASNLALINSLPPGFSFAAPGTAPSAANSVLGPYLPHTCDGYQFQSRDQDDISIEVKLSSDQEVNLADGWLVLIMLKLKEMLLFHMVQILVKGLNINLMFQLQARTQQI